DAGDDGAVAVAVPQGTARHAAAAVGDVAQPRVRGVDTGVDDGDLHALPGQALLVGLLEAEDQLAPRFFLDHRGVRVPRHAALLLRVVERGQLMGGLFARIQCWWS